MQLNESSIDKLNKLLRLTYGFNVGRNFSSVGHLLGKQAYFLNENLNNISFCPYKEPVEWTEEQRIGLAVKILIRSLPAFNDDLTNQLFILDLIQELRDVTRNS